MINSNKEEKLHLGSIDFLRGIASLMVCTLHLTVLLKITNPVKIVASYGYLGVPIFFVISGFIIPYSLYKGNYSINQFFTYIKKRIIRIEPPYIVSIILAISIAYLSSRSPLYKGVPFHFSFLGLLAHLGYLIPFTKFNWAIGVYWTLAIEFQYYIVIGLIISFLIKKENKFIIYCTIIMLLILPFIVSDARFLFHFFPLFVAGILCFQYKCGLITKIEFILFEILALLSVYNQFSNIEFFAVFLIILFIEFINNFKSIIFSFLGKISFSLYL